MSVGWNLLPETRYHALCCLREQRESDILTLLEWGKCAERKGIYCPDGKRTYKKYVTWGGKVGHILARLGLAKRYTYRVTCHLSTGYKITEAGLRWLRNYERNEKDGV